MSESVKLAALIGTIRENIAAHYEEVDKAMSILERIGANEKEYQEALGCFCLNQFVASYLTRIINAISGKDIKVAENNIRFHSFQQDTLGRPTKNKFMAIGQAALIEHLNGYIKEFFEA